MLQFDLRKIFSFLISVKFILSNRIKDITNQDFQEVNISNLCNHSINFINDFIKNDEEYSKVSIEFCTTSSFLENGLFFYLNDNLNSDNLKYDFISNLRLNDNKKVDSFNFLSSIFYSFENSKNKNILSCLSNPIFILNENNEFHLTMNECRNFFNKNKGKILYLEIIIFKFPLIKIASLYNLNLYLNNKKDQKNFILSFPFSIIKRFEKNDFLISLEKDDFDFVNYLFILNLENVNYENLNNLKIKIKFNTNEYKNDNDENLIEYFNSNTKIKYENEYIEAIFFEKSKLIFEINKVNSKLLKFKIENIFLPDKDKINDLNIKLLSNNHKIGILSNQNKISNLSKKSESESESEPYLDCNIEFLNSFDNSEVKITLTSPDLILKQNSLISIQISTNILLDSNLNGICSEKNSKNYKCNFKLLDREKKHNLIEIRNVFDRDININEEIEIYIKFILLDKYLGQTKISFLFQILNNKFESYIETDKIVKEFKLTSSNLFNVNITTEKCYTPTIYKLKSNVNFFNLDFNAILYYTFSEILPVKGKEDVILKFYINDVECLNFKYDLDLTHSLLIRNYSSCFTKDIKISKQMTFDVLIHNLMSPRTIKKNTFEFYYLNNTGNITEYSTNSVKADYSRIINNIQLIHESNNSYDNNIFQFIFLNKNYLLKGDLLVIKSDYKFFYNESDYPHPITRSLNENFEILNGVHNVSRIHNYYLNFKVKCSDQYNKEINLTLINGRNPHSRGIFFFKIEIYDSTGQYLVSESKLNLLLKIDTEIIFSNLNVTMYNDTTIKYQYSPTKLIEAEDIIQLYYDPYCFKILLCSTKNITGVGNNIGCYNYKDNHTVYHPFLYTDLENRVIDSSIINSFLFFHVNFIHTIEPYSQDYIFELDIIDSNRKLKEKGNFMFTIKFDCYYTCETCKDKTFCLSCSEYFPYIMKDLGICLKKCPKGYGINDTDNSCFECNPMSNCDKCDKNDINVCTKCPSDFPLLINNSCFSYCPDNFIEYNQMCINVDDNLDILVKKYKQEKHKYEKEEEEEEKEEKEEEEEEEKEEKEENNENKDYEEDDKSIKNDYHISFVRNNLDYFRIDYNYYFPFDYYCIPISILVIIVINQLLFWKKGYKYNYCGYILFELSVLFKINIYLIYPYSFISGERFIFYNFSIMLTIQYILNSCFLFIYNFIFGIKIDIISTIICIFFDYKLIPLNYENKESKVLSSLSKKNIYLIYTIYTFDILLIYIYSIIIGIYINLSYKEIKILYNLNEYSIIISIFVLFFYIFDFVFPKNTTIEIKKIDENNVIENNINEDNNDIKSVNNELITIRALQTPSTERSKQELKSRFANPVYITNFEP